MRARHVLPILSLVAACGASRPGASVDSASGPVSGTVNGEPFVASSADGLACDHCGGGPEVFAALHDASGATVFVHVDPYLDHDDVELVLAEPERPLDAYVVWQHDGVLRATSGTLHVASDEIARRRLRGCLDAHFPEGGRVSGCFDVLLEHSAGYE